MATTRNNFRLGITVICMFILFVACLLFIAGRGFFQPDTNRLTVRLQTGPALPEIGPGSKVTCFGRPVGEVVDTVIRTVPDPGAPAGADIQYLEIHARVLAELDLRADCRVVVSGPPLGGIGMIEIVDRGVAPARLDADAAVLAAPVGLQSALASFSAELDPANPSGLLALVKEQIDPDERHSLMAKVHTSLGDINRITASLGRELDGAQDDVLLSRLNADLTRVGEVLDEILDLVRENRPKIDNTLASVDHAARRIDREVVASLAHELDREHAGGLIARTHSAFERLDQSLRDINAITAEGRQIVLINSGRLDELVENATEASALLKRGVKDLYLHPWKLLSKPTQAEKDELELIDAAREFATAAAHLDDATTRLQALAEAANAGETADDQRLEEIRAELAESVESYFEAEKALWRALRVDE